MDTICFAYIDGANLEHGMIDLGWELDYKRFRVWLAEKYGATEAYFFIGKMKNRTHTYSTLREAGFSLVFKETIRDSSGKVKGNCDAELVLNAAIGYFERRFSRVVLVSSDGDYACLVTFLKNNGVFGTIISPRNKCSFLLNKTGVPLVYLDTQRSILRVAQMTQNEKALDGDETP